MEVKAEQKPLRQPDDILSPHMSDIEESVDNVAPLVIAQTI